ncbi:MAG: hypothetical protein ACYTFI_25750 [Planctomycetota bacterium]|jgi:hypothetical protein
MRRLFAIASAFLAASAGLALAAPRPEPPRLYAVWQVTYGDSSVRFHAWTASAVQAEQQQADQFYFEQMRRWREDKKLEKPRRAEFKLMSRPSPEYDEVRELARKLKDEYDKARDDEEARKKLIEQLKEEGLTLADTRTFCVMELAGEDGPVFRAVSQADYKRKLKAIEPEHREAVKEWIAARAAAEKEGQEFNAPKPRRGIRRHSRFKTMEDAEAYRRRLEENEAKKKQDAREADDRAPPTKEDDKEEQ